MSKLSLGVQRAAQRPDQSPEEDGSRSLAVLSQGARMLAEARTLDDFRHVRVLALAAQHYARKKGLGLAAQNDAGMVAAEAAIREGEVLIAMREAGERWVGRPQKSENGTPTLAELGITRKEAAEAMALASQAEAVREHAATSKAGKKPITLGRLERIARNHAAADRRPVAPPSQPQGCDIRHGDFREVLADVADGSVDVVLTDPPYPEEYLPLWSDLGIFAARVLKPDGLLVAMSGQLHLPEVYARLGEHMKYRWTIAYIATGNATVIHARRIHSMWKPVVVYGGTSRRLYDVAKSGFAEKRDHEWGQSESGFADLLRLVADPGALICDPFLGAGTTAVVALRQGCSFIGAELQEHHYQTALKRVAA